MSKIKGNRTERELFHMFFDSGWGISRIAGSGSTPLPAPDLIAGKAGRVLAIECKSGKGRRYLKEKEVSELKEFSERFGAEAWIGARFDNEKWLFLEISKLGKGRGKNFYVDLAYAKKYGLRFEELIK